MNFFAVALIFLILSTSTQAFSQRIMGESSLEPPAINGEEDPAIYQKEKFPKNSKHQTKLRTDRRDSGPSWELYIACAEIKIRWPQFNPELMSHTSEEIEKTYPGISHIYRHYYGDLGQCGFTKDVIGKSRAERLAMVCPIAMQKASDRKQFYGMTSSQKKSLMFLSGMYDLDLIDLTKCYNRKEHPAGSLTEPEDAPLIR